MKGIAALSGIDPGWSEKRKIIAAIQVYADRNGISVKPIDGFWGPITEEAYNQLRTIIFPDEKSPVVWRPEEVADVNPNSWPKQYTGEFDDFYGNPGDHLVGVSLPYDHRLSWQPEKKVRSFQCHAKVAESITKVLGQVLSHYGEEEIRRLKLDVWGGCFNIRPIRGGTKPSMHSWGIAIDYDPNRNKLNWGADRAAFAGEEYKKWWELWEAEGWVSLGRSRNFDWMHIQAARIS